SRTRLQDQWRLDLVQLAVADGRYCIPAGTCGDAVGTEFLAAPGAEDEIRRAADDLARISQDAVLRQRTLGTLGEDVVAAGDAHQFGHPLDTGDGRLVPFLEVDAGSPWQRGGTVGDGGQVGTESPGQLRRTIGGAYQR